MTATVLYLFEASSSYLEKKDVKSRKKKKHGEDHILLCKSCKHPVTSESNRIVINQSHVHTCKNPAGLVFTFGCFSEAPGCIASGSTSFEFTWFTGYSWQIVICANCGIHLGWSFRNEDLFFALITERLISQ